MTWERRLDTLERVWPSPAPPATRDPVRWDWLTEEEMATYAEVRAAMSAVDVGPDWLDERVELRKRLDGLTDDQLDRLQALSEKIGRLSEETSR